MPLLMCTLCVFHGVSTVIYLRYVYVDYCTKEAWLNMRAKLLVFWRSIERVCTLFHLYLRSILGEQMQHKVRTRTLLTGFAYT